MGQGIYMSPNCGAIRMMDVQASYALSGHVPKSSAGALTASLAIGKTALTFVVGLSKPAARIVNPIDGEAGELLVISVPIS
jgi:hypothetical protein